MASLANESSIKEKKYLIKIGDTIRISAIRFYGILAVIITLISGFFLKDQIRDFFSSDKKKFDDQNYVNGKLDSKVITDSAVTAEFPPVINGIAIPHEIAIQKIFTLKMGTNTFGDIFIDNISSGVNFNAIVIGCEPKYINIGLKIINDRLYFSTTFKNLKNELVGIIDYNKWSLFKPNLLMWIPTDSSLEVKDRDNNYILRFKFRNPNTIILQGYFVGIQKVLVVGETSNCFAIDSQRIDILKEVRTIDNLPF